MKASQNCINLIKQFEGCRLTAYKDSVGVLTIGYGHTKGVTSGMKITQSTAEQLLAQDLAKFEKHVGSFSKYKFNQNQFDALVSFAFNVGSITKLTANGTRSIEQISAKIPAYNKAGDKVLAGLTRRRKAEKALFDKAVTSSNVKPASTQTNVSPNVSRETFYKKYVGTSSSLTVALKAVGIDSSFSNRKKIANANGISTYSGTASQNTQLLLLLKQGKLRKV